MFRAKPATHITVCVLQPPNTPLSIKTGATLLAVMKAEAGPTADGCICPGSVWIPSGVHIVCARQTPNSLQGRKTFMYLRCFVQIRTAAACTWCGTRARGS